MLGSRHSTSSLTEKLSQFYETLYDCRAFRLVSGGGSLLCQRHDLPARCRFEDGRALLIDSRWQDRRCKGHLAGIPAHYHSDTPVSLHWSHERTIRLPLH